MLLKFLPSNLAKNFASMGTLQGASLLTQLIIAPYVIRKIGVENYGAVSVSLALIAFFTVASDYGFNLTATRDVSLSRNNKNKLSEIVSRVLICKSIILIACFVLFCGLVFSVSSFKSESTLHLFTYTMLLGQAVMPFWFYQGIERIKYITFLMVVGRIAALILILIFINKETDYIFVNLISGVTSLFPALIGIFRMFRNYELKFVAPSMDEVLQELKDGFLILTSNLSSFAYSFFNIIVLNFLVGDKYLVGSYSIAEKVIVFVKQILIVYSQVIYPHLCSLALKGFEDVRSFFIKNYIPFLLLVVFGSGLLWIIAPYIILFLSGLYNNDAIHILRLLAIVPIIITLNIPFYQILLVYDFRLNYSSILIFGAILNFILAFILIVLWEATGCALAIIITESFITIALFLAVRAKYLRSSFTSKII